MTSQKLKTFRKTVVRALADPESFGADMIQKLHLKGDTSDSRAEKVDNLLHSGLYQEQVIDDFSLQDVIDQKKLDMPLRLICTEDGRLYERDTIEARFKAEHASFFDPDAKPSDSCRMVDAVKTSFAYAMFSHRWETVEPSHRDVHGSNVFSLPESPGTRNLQHFVRHAREHGFRWAWSDTCCIDKNSTAELQKSIISMFKWYRNSDLTIVYLGDVSDNSIEAFKKSVWFFRGWTLQELIAPRRLLFYQSDWTQLITSPDLPLHNYKESSEFRQLITKITGIDDNSLIHFDPTSRQPNIRERMSWAAHRKTTEIEDVAYCLMGIFNVHFPVMYGEGESAFYRLQIEIMGRSDDPSLFDWTGKHGSNSFIASSPACFDPFAPLIVDPVPATMRIAEIWRKLPSVPRVQHGIDQLSVGLFNMQQRFCGNAQHPANYMAGAKVHCHGLEYRVLDVEETELMSDARKVGHEDKVFQYHIITESLHPLTVTLAEPIKVGFGHGRIRSESMCIFRVWDPSLMTGQWTEENEGYHPLRQPFAAHLLISRPGGIHRRIEVRKRIVAKLAHPLDFRMNVHMCTLTIE